MILKELFKFAEKDRNIEEIIVLDEKRKVYFDVDCFGDISKILDEKEKSKVI